MVLRKASNRPAQPNQKSRKSKKAWRKNIDLEDLEEGLELQRDFEIATGYKDSSAVDSKRLFTVDTEGDISLKPKNLRLSKPLRADDIISKRSAVPALASARWLHKSNKAGKKGKIQGVDKRELGRIIRISGYDGLGNQQSERLKTDGLIAAKGAYDLWDTEKVAQELHVDPFIADLMPSLTQTEAVIRPETLSQPPIPREQDPLSRAGVEAVPLPVSGRSYNPTIESWKELLIQEHAKEEEREAQRQVYKKQNDRIQQLIDELDYVENEADLGSSDDEDDEDTSATVGRISVNDPTPWKKKVRVVRNKEKRRKERKKLETELAALKQQIRDIDNLPQILQNVEKAIQEAEETAQSGKRRKRIGPKYELPDAPLVIKLSDELQDSLRRLVPEGNFCAERFRSLQARGLIETRVPVTKVVKYPKREVENLAYKHITL